MITLIEKLTEGETYQNWYEFTEEGDTLIVSPSTPVLGSSFLRKIVLDEQHDSEGSFVVKFKYSVDGGLNWSEFVNSQQLLEISLKKNHWFVVEVTVVKKGSGNSYFKGIKFELDFSLPPQGEFYNSSIKGPNKQAYYNHNSIVWALNVLNKIYKKGLLPSFIERGDNLQWSDEDFINLWWSIIYPVALRFNFAEEFTDLLWHPELLKDFLEQRGLILGNLSGLDELFYLMTHFYDEVSRRGTLSVFDRSKKIGDYTIRGELARLIDLKEDSELFLSLTNSWETGWWLGKTSICGYENTDNYDNYRIGYENQITSLDNYSLLQGSQVQIEDGLMKISSSGEWCGIGNDANKKVLNVSPQYDYAVVVVMNLLEDQEVHFGVRGYDSIGNEMGFENLRNQPTSLFFEGILPKGSYCLWGRIKSQRSSSQDLIDGLSSTLQFVSESSISLLMPEFWCKGNTEIVDFKVCLLSQKFIYLESIFVKSVEIILQNNNLNYTDDQIEKIIKTKLLPLSLNCTLTFV